VQLADSARGVCPSHRLVAPNSIRSEALDLPLQRVRGGTLTEQADGELHERMTGMKMRLLGDRVSRRTAWQMARDRACSTIGEAENLAVAKLQADALITRRSRACGQSDEHRAPRIDHGSARRLIQILRWPRPHRFGDAGRPPDRTILPSRLVHQLDRREPDRLTGTTAGVGAVQRPGSRRSMTRAVFRTVICPH
jgi:hypothetical protein